MDISSIKLPLSNVQVELLKIFRANIPEENLFELKGIIAKFLFEIARDRADQIWDEKNYSDEKLKVLFDGK